MIHVGQTESVKRILSQADFDRFAALSGDDNPIHVDPEFAARTKFGRTVAHGMFLYSIVCSALSSRLPGPGVVQLEQELMFPNATYAGTEITIQLEVTRLQAADNLAELSTLVRHTDGKLGLQGHTTVCLPGIHTLARQLATEAPRQPSDRAVLKGLEVGQRAQTRRVFTLQDSAEYAALTDDRNPVFTDVAFARTQGLQGTIVPGGLLGGLFSYLLGTELPGRGTNYLKQRLSFPGPAYVGQEVTACVEISRIRPEKQLVNLSAVCIGPAGRIVCQGEALVLVRDVEREA